MADYDDDFEVDTVAPVASTPLVSAARVVPRASNAPSAAGPIADDYDEDGFEIEKTQELDDGYGDEGFDDEVSRNVPISVTSSVAPAKPAAKSSASAAPVKQTTAAATTPAATNRLPSSSSSALDEYNDDFEGDNTPAPVAKTPAKTPAKPPTAASVAAAVASPAAKPLASHSSMSSQGPPSATSRTLEPSYSQEDFDLNHEEKQRKLKPSTSDDALVDYKNAAGATKVVESTLVKPTPAAAKISTPASSPAKPTAAASPPAKTSTVATPAKPAAAATTAKPAAAASSPAKPAVTTTKPAVAATPTAASPKSTATKPVTSTPAAVTSPQPTAAAPVAAAAKGSAEEADEYGADDDFDDDSAKKQPPPAAVTSPAKPTSPEPLAAKLSPKVTPRSAHTSPITSPRSSMKNNSAVDGRAVPSSKKIPPVSATSPRAAASKPKIVAAAAPTSTVSEPKKGADYDRIRREALKARRAASDAVKAKNAAARAAGPGGIQSPTSSSKKSSSSKKKKFEEEKLNSDADDDEDDYADDNEFDTTTTTKKRSSVSKAPILPPPLSPKGTAATAGMSDADFMKSIMGEPVTSGSSSARTKPRSGTASSRRSPSASKSPVRRAAQPRPSTSRKANIGAARNLSPHPPPWAGKTGSQRPQTAAAKTTEQEEKTSEEATIDQNDPHVMYNYLDAQEGFVSDSPHAIPHGSPSSRSRGPHPPHHRSSRAANARARQKIIAALSVGAHPSSRPGTSRTARPVSAYSVQSTYPSTASAASTDAWVEARALESSLESQGLVHRAAEILRNVATETSTSKPPPAEVPEIPLNATEAIKVPRCYPASSITPRLGNIRFRRRVDPMSRSGFELPTSTRGGRDVSAELAYGHSIVEGLRARNQNLAWKLDSTQPATTASYPGSDSARAASNLFQSVRVAQSLENYYSLLGQLDIRMKQAEKNKGMLHRVLFEPQVPTSSNSGENTSRARSANHTSHSFRPQSASDNAPAWVHTNMALPPRDLSHQRPPSSHRDFPLVPPSFIPNYDSISDPHVGVMSPNRGRVIRTTRGDEFAAQPELAHLLDARVHNYAEERADEAFGLEQDRARKWDRPESEHISQRPKSAAATQRILSPSSKARMRAFGNKSQHIKKGGMSARLKMVSSVYSNNAGNTSQHTGYPRTGSKNQNSKSKQKQAGQEYQSYQSGAGATDDYLDGLPPGMKVRNDDDGLNAEDYQFEDLDSTTDNSRAPTAHRKHPHNSGAATDIRPLPSTTIDWFEITRTAWPKEPSQLTKDLLALGLIYGSSAPAGTANDKDSASLPEDSPTRLCSDFYLAERCLQALHSQLGLPFTVSDQQPPPPSNPPSAPNSPSHGSAFRFSPARPPTLQQVQALKAAIGTLIACRDQVVLVVKAIEDREPVVVQVKAELSRLEQDRQDVENDSDFAPAASSGLFVLLSSLARVDHALLTAIANYGGAMKSTFGERVEFEGGCFGWKKEDLTERILLDKKQILARKRSLESETGLAPSPKSSTLRGRSAVRRSAEISIEHLASTYLPDRSGQDLASAAAAIVLNGLKKEARSIKAQNGGF